MPPHFKTVTGGIGAGQGCNPAAPVGLLLVADHVAACRFPKDQATIAGFADVGQFVSHGSRARSPSSLAAVTGVEK